MNISMAARLTDSSKRAETSNLFDKGIRFGLYAILCLMPLWYGGVTAESYLFLGSAVSFLFLLWLFREIRRPENLRFLWRRCFRATGFEVIFLLAAGIYILQLVPIPLSMIKVLSPTTHRIYEKTNEIIEQSPFVEERNLFKISSHEDTLESSGWGTLSLSPFKTLQGFFHLLFLSLFFLLLVNGFRGRKELEFLVKLIIILGVMQTIYGFFEYLSGHHHVLFHHLKGMRGVSGTFINANHCAGYLEMSGFCALGLVFHRIRNMGLDHYRSWKHIVRVLFSDKNAPFMMWLLFALIISFGVVFTKSRSGITFFCLGLLLFFLLSFSSLKNWKIGAIFILITIGCIYWTGLDQVGERFEQLSRNYPGRYGLWRDTVNICWHFPMFGSGMNTFQLVYPFCKLQYRPDLPHHAHNDYLELMSESGVAGFLLLGVILIFFHNQMRDLRKQATYRFNALVIGCLVGMVTISLHGLTDFNFHIPANQINFVALLAIFLVLMNGFQHDTIRISKNVEILVDHE
ncbi:O-antigen ligase family protein [candidate division CSSED10-310 bacterium]|uniref:O-antigen ligase family protein n=1 Tax=candidate division CSSED10-310 bacterium TaxID=2855610 RepID=A0ABV6Z525_UNCC1